MNPPFISNRNRRGKGREGTINPLFAAFGIPPKDQLEMGKLLTKKYRGTCSDGKAGGASYFMAIADAKLKEDGRLGMIIPASVGSGTSWKKVRHLISKKYKDVILVSIAAEDDEDRAFSAYTGMADVILVATRSLDSNPATRMRVVTLYHRPQSVLEGNETGYAISKIHEINKLEDGPVGGTLIKLGDDSVGEILDCPLSGIWQTNIADFSIVQMAYSLTAGKFQTVDGPPCPVTMVTIGDLAEMSPDAQMLIGRRQKGPFTKHKIQKNKKPIYTALWSNDSETQKSIIVEPDSMLSKKGDAPMSKVRNLWSKASRVHVNSTARLTSQALVALYTEKPVLGGRSHPGVCIDQKYEKAISLWLNSTFGIVCFWLVGGRQQMGRIMMSRLAMKNIPIPDFRCMDDSDIKKLDAAFTRYSKRDLLPINQLDRDPVRIKIDEIIANLFKLSGDLDDLRTRFCAEPHIRNEEKNIEELDELD
ncbi:MAG: hypothetical protein MPK62_03140 [Alphaproteobacteria bacterium]|nr:hypothetical protein [Alphaproteobacteria bacterium]